MEPFSQSQLYTYHFLRPKSTQPKPPVAHDEAPFRGLERREALERDCGRLAAQGVTENRGGGMR